MLLILALICFFAAAYKAGARKPARRSIAAPRLIVVRKARRAAKPAKRVRRNKGTEQGMFEKISLGLH